MSDNTNIDESLYNRQLYVLGQEAMKKMAKSSILISGMGGLGVEIAKNIILAGVNRATIHDTQNATIKDLSSQYYLDESSIGKNRATESFQKLTSLNEYTNVSVSTAELTTDLIKNYNCVVLTEPLKYSKIFEISQFCHEKGIHFVLAMTRGVFGFVYNDFGDTFIVREPNARPLSRFLIESITHDKEGIVYLNPKERHNLSLGDYVVFDNVKGMTELNGKQFPAKYVNYRAFSIGDTSQFHPYDSSSAGYGTQVVLPKTVHFKELKEALKKDNFVCLQADSTYRERGPLVVCSFFSLFKSIEENDTSVENVLKNASIFNKEFQLLESEIDESFIREFIREDAVLAPSSSILGGVAGQEAIKSVSGKFVPIQMFFTLSYLEALQPINETFKTTMKNDRYDGYRLVFGDNQFEKMASLNYFIVGAGAIGCEILKNWAMMGVSKNGKIHITDMDRIERSNLNRQFLYSVNDIGKYKSQVAAEKARIMNPDLEGHIEAYEKEVGPKSESFYNTEFYNNLNGICNALDNINARTYNGVQAIYYSLPLLESGTEGPMGNFEIFIPHRTLAYDPNRYPPSTSVLECTVHYFPSNINHCTIWAKREFETLFKSEPSKVNKYIVDLDYVHKLMTSDKGALVDNLKIIKKLLVDEKPSSFNDCVKLARNKFEELFNYNIRALITKYPKDHKTDNGCEFWGGSYRFPSSIEYDATNELYANFIKATAKLYAVMYKIEIPQDQLENAANLALNVDVIEYKPEDYVIEDIDANGNDKKEKKTVLPSNFNSLCKGLCQHIRPSRKKENKLTIQEFDKDNNEKGHIDFVVAAANIRALNYSIKPESALEIKKIAGKIIPAIATTTASVCGFVSLEMFKVHSVTDKKISDSKDGFINLASNSYTMIPSRPVQPKKMVIKDANGNIKKEILFTFWDKWIIEGDLTVSEFANAFKKKFDLNVTAMFVGTNIVYGDVCMNSQQYENRKITDIYRKDAKLNIKPDRMIPLNLELYDDGKNRIKEYPTPMLKFF